MWLCAVFVFQFIFVFVFVLVFVFVGEGCWTGDRGQGLTAMCDSVAKESEYLAVRPLLLGQSAPNMNTNTSINANTNTNMTANANASTQIQKSVQLARSSCFRWTVDLRSGKTAFQIQFRCFKTPLVYIWILNQLSKKMSIPLSKPLKSNLTFQVSIECDRGSPYSQ